MSTPTFEGPNRHTVVVESLMTGQSQAWKFTCQGNDRMVAAWLRAMADELDPPRPITRSMSPGSEPVVHWTSGAGTGRVGYDLHP